jgi:hypothetical protein
MRDRGKMMPATTQQRVKRAVGSDFEAVEIVAEAVSTPP